MPRIVKVLVVLLIAIAAATSFLLVRARSERLGGEAAGDASGGLTPDPKVQGLVVPPFELSGQDGSAVTNEAFAGHLTFVDFFFTNCPFVCPMLTAKMTELATALHAEPSVRMLSISVDPAHDSPEQLKEYAKSHRIETDAGRWTFATAAKPDRPVENAFKLIQAIAADGLKFNLAPDPSKPINLKDGTTMHNVSHPSFFVLVGPKGEVLDFFAATVPGETERAVERAKAAATALKKASR